MTTPTLTGPSLNVGATGRGLGGEVGVAAPQAGVSASGPALDLNVPAGAAVNVEAPSFNVVCSSTRTFDTYR